MSDLNFLLVDHFDSEAPALAAEHMGDGMFVITEKLEDGLSERICMTIGQIAELYATASSLYGQKGLADVARGSYCPELKAI